MRGIPVFVVALAIGSACGGKSTERVSATPPGAPHEPPPPPPPSLPAPAPPPATPSQRVVTLRVVSGKGTLAVSGTSSLSQVTRSCDSSCSVELDDTDPTSVWTVPAEGFVFTGYGGTCSGMRCDPTTSADAEITASFAPAAAIDLPRYEFESVSSHFTGDIAASALGEDGSVAGFTCRNDECSAFVWTPASLAIIGLPKGLLVSINATEGGHIAGSIQDGDGSPEHAFAGGRDIGTLGGPASVALGVNRAGTVVGSSFTAAGELHAFVWSGGAMEDLAPRTGKRESRALRIDEAGTISVVACDHLTFAPPEGCHALRLRATGVEDLGPVPDRVLAMSTNGNAVGVDVVDLAGHMLQLEPLLARSAWPSIQMNAGSNIPSVLLSGVNSSGDAVASLSLPISEGWIGTGVFVRRDTVVEIDRLLGSTVHVHSPIAINDRGQMLARTRLGPGANYLLLTPRR